MKRLPFWDSGRLFQAVGGPECHFSLGPILNLPLHGIILCSSQARGAPNVGAWGTPSLPPFPKLPNPNPDPSPSPNPNPMFVSGHGRTQCRSLASVTSRRSFAVSDTRRRPYPSGRCAVHVHTRAAPQPTQSHQGRRCRRSPSHPRGSQRTAERHTLHACRSHHAAVAPPLCILPRS